MTNKLLTLLYLVDGESTPFPVKIEFIKTIGGLKKAIKDEKAPEFDGIAADKLTLWHVSIPVADDNDDDDDMPILLNNILKNDKKRLKAATNTVSDVFGNAPDGKMIHVTVQRPQPIPARALTPVPSTPSDNLKWM